VIKTHKLTYEEVDVMHAIFTRASQPHHWRLSSTLLKEFMEHFAPKAEQLDISTANGRAAFTSFTEKLIDGKEILKQPLQTSVALDTSDFEEFRVEDNLHIAVSLKDFKAIAAHAASVEVAVAVYYSQSGKPLQVHYVRDGMECEFTLMTASDTRSSQAFGAMGRVMPISRPTPAGGSQQGREATEEWGQEAEGQQSQTENQTQSQLTPELPSLVVKDDESLYNAPTPGPQSAPAALKQELGLPTPNRANRHDVPLFLNYSEDEEEDDDLGMDLDNERSGFSLGWDTSGQEPLQPVTVTTPRRSRTNHYTDEDEEESGVGPTPQSNVPKGLFD
jgi:cell cycle checkpoint control protein RAD9A